jgi:autotransporter translocation and assembly factor TamB
MADDDRDDAPPPQGAPPPESTERKVVEALQSETDEPLPPAVEKIAERDADRPEPVTPQGQRRRFLTRRNAMFAAIGVAIGAVALIIIALTAYRLGFIDRYIANQIKSTLAEYGIRAEIKEFKTDLSPRTVTLTSIDLYDQKTGEKLGKIDSIIAKVRIEDLYALNLRRNINLEELTVNGLELWVKFDAEGNSNFRNLKLPPPAPNQRILFSYSTAIIKVNNAVVHYGDERHDISGEARNIVARIHPENPSAPVESRTNAFTLSLSNSTFSYDGRPVNDISVEARGRANQTRAEIDELVLRSPLAESRLQGTMDDWRNLRYQLQITSTVDLTQASDILQAGTALRGVGTFEGKVTGEGDRYTVDGQIKSDALAADNVRLKALNVTARATGQGESYEANGRVIAELLTAGDFQLSAFQLAGNVMGTGTDFRWIGDLRAAAARYPGTNISGLILTDATAESRAGVWTASASRASLQGINTGGATVSGAQVSNLSVRSENNVTVASAASAQAGTINASGTRVNGVTASGVDVVDRDGTTSVVVNQVRVGGVSASGATIGSLNIAGVRLQIRDGRIQGSSSDIDAGTVNIARSGDFEGGQVENVRLARPVFTVEPGGRYRVSADLSLGGGLRSTINLGAARASVVATNNQIQLNNFNAELLNGRASGNATVSTTSRGMSRINAEFTDLDIDKLAALGAKQNVPVTGKTTGTVDLTFPGTNFKEGATGTLRADFTGEAGNKDEGGTGLTGTVAVRADRGLFQIETARLRTPATELNASGKFSFASNESNLQLDLASADASELQRVLKASGLLPGVEEQFENYGIELAGKLAFNGTVRGNLNDPSVDGRASLETLLVNKRDLGTLSASLNMTPDELRINDGRLVERDGGGLQFSLIAPRAGENNIALDATLERANAANLAAAFPAADNQTPSRFSDIQSDVSGRINVTGIPNAMMGSADLRFGAGRVAGQPFETITARATFERSRVNLESVDARFEAGRITANGTYDIASKDFNIEARGANVQLDRLHTLAANPAALPRLTGAADLTAHVAGNLTNFKTFQITVDGTGRDVTINGRPAGEVTLVGRTENQQFNLNFTTGILGQPQVVTARVDLGSERLRTNIETTLTGADLTQLFAVLLPDSGVKMKGRATGTLKIVGDLVNEDEEFTAKGLQGTAIFTDLTVQIADVQLAAVSPLQVKFSSDQVDFENTRFTGPGTNVEIGGTLALSKDGRQEMTVNGSLNLRVLNGLSPDVFLSGAANVNVRVSGSYEQPRVFGTASVAGGTVATLIGDERLTIQNVDARIIFNANQAQINNMTGTLGGGRVTVTGGALLAGFVPSRFRLNVRGDDVTVPFPEDFSSTADADLDINGTRSASGVTTSIISGTVNLRRAEYTQDIDIADLINQRREASLTEGAGESDLTANTQLDLRVEGRDALVVRNNLADIVGSVSLRITGPVEDPLVAGRISATRGTLNFRNDRYEVTRAFIDLPPRRDADPILNIQAETDVRGYRIIIGLTGPLSQPNAVVRSDPSLPQADVVALITTGQLGGAGESSGSVLAQSGVGTAASLLADQVINAPLKRATSKLYGLSLELDPLIAGRGGASPTARLKVTQPINKNLSITYSTNVTADQNQILAVEYRVSNRLSFIAQYEQGSTSGFSSRNDNFSFEIRFRKRF